jgi:hypothetical protein
MKKFLFLLSLVAAVPLQAEDEAPLVCPSSTLCAQRLNTCLNTALNAGGDLETAAARCFAQYETCTSPEWCLPVY